MGKPQHRNKFGRTPAKGTQLRMMLRMLMRAEGASTMELVEVGVNRHQVATYVQVLIDQKGWDIRSFYCPNWRKINFGSREVVYKVVGKVSWKGRYRKIADGPVYNDVEEIEG